jgi:hypothetical protein
MMTATLRKSRMIDMLAQPKTQNSRSFASAPALEDKILERILRKMSQDSFDYLKQRDDFRDLSFSLPAGSLLHDEED